MVSPGPKPEVTPESVLEVFRERDDPSAPLTATEVANELDCARRTAYSKLRNLVEQDELKSKKTGARGRVWWRPGPVTNVSQAALEVPPNGDRAAFTTLVDAVSEYAIFRLDPRGNVVSWNEGGRRIKGYSRSDIVGTHFSIFYTDADRQEGVPEANLTDAAEHGTCEDEGLRVRKDGSQFWANVVITALYDDEGALTGFLKVTRDMTDRREHEQELHEELALTDRLLETSPMGVAMVDPTGEITRANARTEKMLGLTRSEIEGRTYDEPEWNIYYEDGQLITPDEHPVTQVLETGEPVLGFVHGITLSDGTEQWLSSNSAPMFDDDGDLERVIVTLEDVTELKMQEQEIHRQRNDLKYLNRVNEIIRGIDHAIVAADSQAEIEQAVCERIAASDPYLFAVIGDFSSSYETFTPRSFAGIGEEYLDSILHSEDAPPVSEGPGAKAAQTETVQVAQQLAEFPHEFWEESAREYGFQSYASVPLVYEDMVYGVLGVYASRPDAFDEEERDILGELGDMIGHAINAIERKEALLADTVVELEFREAGALAGFFEGIGDTSGETSRIERTVLLEGGDAVQYYTVTGMDTERFTSALEEVPSIDRVRILDQNGDTARIEVRTSGQMMASVLATYGGRIRSTTFEEGEVRVLAEIPYGTDTRQVIDAVQDVYPDMEFVSRTTQERSTQTVIGLQEAVAEALTERQRAALEAGYQAGFFDWPRDSTGEDLAELMGVSPSTFHKHLRFGERKLLRLLFDHEE